MGKRTIISFWKTEQKGNKHDLILSFLSTSSSSVGLFFTSLFLKLIYLSLLIFLCASGAWIWSHSFASSTSLNKISSFTKDRNAWQETLCFKQYFFLSLYLSLHSLHQSSWLQFYLIWMYIFFYFSTRISSGQSYKQNLSINLRSTHFRTLLVFEIFDQPIRMLKNECSIILQWNYVYRIVPWCCRFHCPTSCMFLSVPASFTSSWY